MRAMLLGLALLSACGPVGEDNPRDTTSHGGNDSAAGTAPHRDSLIVPGIRIGGVTRTTSETDLIALYGTAAVRRDSVYVGEGEFEPGTLVFPDSPAQLEIIWQDSSAKCPRHVLARQPQSPWRTAGGAGIGAHLRDIVRENGRPFKFSGFDWDYSGYVSDWGGGALDGLSARFGWPEQLSQGVDPDKMATLGGDRLLSSDDPTVILVQPVLVQIGLGWSPDDPGTDICRERPST